MNGRKQKVRFRTRTLRFETFVAVTCWVLTSQAATLVTSSIDGGGGRSGAGVYANDGCIGGCVGGSSTGVTAVRHGFTGQLAEPVSVALTGTPNTVGEGATSQLNGFATLNDDSLTALSGSDITWGLAMYPLASLSLSGLATASIVYSNTWTTVHGTYLGMAGLGTLQVLDTLTDNYGSYASDGIPDWWQAHYFGVDNGDALATMDPDGDRQDNLYEWTTLTVPTDSASRFRLSIANVSGEPGQKVLTFSPRWNERTYTPLYKIDLAGNNPWSPLSTVQTFDVDAERFLTDTNALSNTKFYRIQITIP